MAIQTMRDAWVAAASDWLDADPRAVIILADIGLQRFAESGALARHPERLINVGIREALAVGTAAGFALEGFMPMVHSYAPFLVERAFEQIKLDLVHQALPSLLVSIGGSFDASAEGRTHQSPGDVALLGTLPGMRIEVPGHPREVKAALTRAQSYSGTSYIRLSALENARPHSVLHVVKEGQSGTILAVGPMLEPTLAATEGLDLRVVYTRRVLPAPEDLSDALSSGPWAVVEPYLEGSSLPFLGERLGPRAWTCFGVPRTEHRRYGQPEDHARAHRLDAAGLRSRIYTWMGAPSTRRAPRRSTCG